MLECTAKPDCMHAIRTYVYIHSTSNEVVLAACMYACGPEIQLTHLLAHAHMCMNYIKLLLLNEIQDIAIVWT